MLKRMINESPVIIETALQALTTINIALSAVEILDVNVQVGPQFSGVQTPTLEYTHTLTHIKITVRGYNPSYYFKKYAL